MRTYLHRILFFYLFLRGNSRNPYQVQNAIIANMYSIIKTDLYCIQAHISISIYLKKNKKISTVSLEHTQKKIGPRVKGPLALKSN